MPKEKEIHDASATEEYFKLKQQLCLTDEERLFFQYVLPQLKRQLDNRVKIRNIKELVSEVRNYKEKYHISLEYLGRMLDMKHQMLSRILLEQVVPQPKTVEKLKRFIEVHI